MSGRSTSYSSGRGGSLTQSRRRASQLLSAVCSDVLVEAAPEEAMGATTIDALHPEDAAALHAGARDPAAFAALYRRYADDVYRYPPGESGADAEDLGSGT